MGKQLEPLAVEHIGHPEIARAYEAEKLRGAEIWPDDSLAYNEEKAVWVGSSPQL